MSLYGPAGVNCPGSPGCGNSSISTFWGLEVNTSTFWTIGSSDQDYDDWYVCEWCGWWGYLAGPDVSDKYKLYEAHVWKNVPFATLLCMRCLELEEPPWWPNNRDMCHEWLLQEFRKTALPPLDTHIFRRIAEYIAENMPDFAEDHPAICGDGCAEVRPAANTCMFG